MVVRSIFSALCSFDMGSCRCIRKHVHNRVRSEVVGEKVAVAKVAEGAAKVVAVPVVHRKAGMAGMMGSEGTTANLDRQWS